MKFTINWKASVLLVAIALVVGTCSVLSPSAPAELPSVPETPMQSQAATITMGNGVNWAVHGGATPATSGIENVFIMNHGFGDDADDNFFHLQTADTEENGPKENENIYEYNDNDQVLRASGDTISVNADNAFDIVVVYKVHSTEANAPEETDNFRLEIIFSGAIAVEENDNSDYKFCFDNDQSNGGAGETWGRWATVLNGGGDGYTLSAGSNFTIDNIALYCWK